MMQGLLNHHVVRSIGVAGLVGMGFFFWLVAHDAIAKPARKVAVMPAAVAKPGERSMKAKARHAARASPLVQLPVVRNMVKAWAHQAPRGTSVATSVAAQPAMGTVNINTASLEELQRLPGIGPSKAALIIAWRQKHREFRRAVDLRRVKGIGYKTYKKLEPYLTVNGDTTLRGR